MTIESKPTSVRAWIVYSALRVGVFLACTGLIIGRAMAGDF